MDAKWYFIFMSIAAVAFAIGFSVSEYFKGQKIDHCVQLQIQYGHATPESLLKCKEVYK